MERSDDKKDLATRVWGNMMDTPVEVTIGDQGLESRDSRVP